MLKTLEKTCQRTLLCSAPVSMAPNATLDLLGLPDASEIRLLVVAVGIFLTAGYVAFQIWGRPAASQRAGEPRVVPALAI